jgi:phosphoglycolate phosphatase
LKPSNRYALIVFDWDGTLMDSTAGIAVSIQEAAREMGLPVPAREAASHVIGLGLQDSLRSAVPSLPPEKYMDFVALYRKHFNAQQETMDLFPGVREMLEELGSRRFKLAVATGKSRRGLDRVLERTGLAALFDATRCGEEAASKPAPAMLLDLQSELGVAAARTLMIGDTTHDLQMAQNAGVASLAAAFGAHPREQLLALEPLACLDEPDALWQWLARHA